jgi:hypothetical protein
MSVDPSTVVVDGRILGGIYCGLLALGSLQFGRTCWSRSRRLWSLQSAFLALCLGWTACRAVYFTMVFEDSESCRGFSCVGGAKSGETCNSDKIHPSLSNECPEGECLSNSPLSCVGQHILFGLPTMIQSFMLSTLIVFYSYWVHKAKSSGRLYRYVTQWTHGLRCVREINGLLISQEAGAHSVRRLQRGLLRLLSSVGCRNALQQQCNGVASVRRMQRGAAQQT